MLSDKNGRNTVTYSIATSYDYVFQNGYLKQLELSSNTLFIEPHYTNQWYRNKNDLVFSVLRPVYNLSKEVIGFAVADVSCQLFSDSFDINPDNPFSLYVINQENGHVIFSPDNDVLHLNSSECFSPDIMSQLSGTSGDFFYRLNDQNMLVVYYQSSLTGWYTLNLIPETHIISTFSSAARNNIIITIVLTLLLAFVLYILCFLLTNNILKLTRAVSEIGVNGLHTDINIYSNDEIGALAAQFQNMLDRIKQLICDVQNEEAEKRNAEIAALQYQINPHFLYNTLNTIKFLATLQGADNIRMVAESLSSLMHISMSGEPFITIREDIEFIKSYLTIQNYRETGIFQHYIDAEPEAEDYYIPKLLIQPLVENALKHGLAGKINGILRISYFQEDAAMHIRVEDNGIGMNDEKIQEILSCNHSANAGHIGIYNIQNRIHLYFGDKYGIQVESQENLFTRFEITIPLLEERDIKSHEKNITC